MTDSAPSQGDREPRYYRRRATADEKVEAVLRLLRGEEREAVAKEIGISAERLGRWESTFLGGARAALLQAHEAQRHGRKVNGVVIAGLAAAFLAVVLSVVIIARFVTQASP
jgi:transposase-like protein